MDAPDIAEYRGQLQARCRGEVLDAPHERAARAVDFGGMRRVTPALVLRPACVEDVQTAVRFASERDLPVSVRGTGHSQSGQGLGAGLLLEMTSLNRLVGLNRFRQSIEVEAGMDWRAMVDITFPDLLLPVALTHALDTTVGGTLSMGGIGSAAWRYGPQVDNLSFLDVVTSSGDLVRCSLEEERDLFDAVRAGLGQCGIIVRAGIPLRACGSGIETRAFVYRELDALLYDAQRLAAEPVPARLLAVRVAPDPLYQRRLMAVLFVGDEPHSDEAASARVLPASHDYEPPSLRTALWAPDGCPGHPFFRTFGTPHLAPGWNQTKNPWVDLLYPVSAASVALAALAQDPDQLFQRGSAQIIFVRRGPSPAPLLVTPHAELIVGLGMFPTFAAHEAERAGVIMGNYARTMGAHGGTRYLCGYFDGSEENDWAAHYGPAWSSFCAAKVKYDPTPRFGSSLVRFEGPPPEGDRTTWPQRGRG